MKKNLFLRAAAMLTVFAMFSLCTIPRTLSKFSESPAISGKSVRAGIFRVCVKEGGNWVPLGNTVNIDLFTTLYEAFQDTSAPPGTTTGETVGDTGHIMSKPGLMSSDAALKDKAIIAPGCGGSFDIAVKNFSEVDVAVKVDVPGGGATSPVPIQWWNDSLTTLNKWQDQFPGLAGGVVQLNALPKGGTIDKSYTFYWRWAFERGTAPSGTVWYYEKDPEDTGLGVVGNGVYSLPVQITATQID